MKKELFSILNDERENIDFLIQLGVVSPSLSRNLDIYSEYLRLRSKGNYKEDCYLIISENFKPKVSLGTVKKVVLALSKQVKLPN